MQLTTHWLIDLVVRAGHSVVETLLLLHKGVYNIRHHPRHH